MHSKTPVRFDYVSLPPVPASREDYRPMRETKMYMELGSVHLPVPESSKELQKTGKYCIIGAPSSVDNPRKTEDFRGNKVGLTTESQKTVVELHSQRRPPNFFEISDQDDEAESEALGGCHGDRSIRAKKPRLLNASHHAVTECPGYLPLGQEGSEISGIETTCPQEKHTTDTNLVTLSEATGQDGTLDHFHEDSDNPVDLFHGLFSESDLEKDRASRDDYDQCLGSLSLSDDSDEERRGSNELSSSTRNLRTVHTKAPQTKAKCHAIPDENDGQGSNKLFSRFGPQKGAQRLSGLGSSESSDDDASSEYQPSDDEQSSSDLELSPALPNSEFSSKGLRSEPPLRAKQTQDIHTTLQTIQNEGIIPDGHSNIPQRAAYPISYSFRESSGSLEPEDMVQSMDHASNRSPTPFTNGSRAPGDVQPSPSLPHSCSPSNPSNDYEDCLRLPPSVSSFSPLEKVLRLEEYRPGHFKWERHTCRHDLDNLMPPDSDIWSSCAVLSRIDGMFYCPVLDGVLCPKDLGIIPLAELGGHIRRYHTLALNDAKISVEGLIDHVNSVYQIPVDQSADSIVESVLPLRFDATFQNLSPPREYLPCKLCNGWFSGKKPFRSHLRRSRAPCLSILMQRSPDDSEDAVVQTATEAASKEQGWATRLFFGTGTYSKYCIAYVDGFKPEADSGCVRSEPALADKPSLADTDTQWPWWIGVSGVNWACYLQKLLDAGSSWSVLCELVSLPARDKEKRLKAEELIGSPLGKKVEKGLEVFSNQVAGRYLLEANDVAQNSGPEVLKWLLQLAGNTFRDFASGTYIKYRQLLYRHVALYARFIIINRSERQQELGKFIPMVSESEAEILNRMFLQLKRGESADPAILAKELHLLVIEIFTRTLSSREPINSSLQQVLLFSAMQSEEGYFRNPNDITPLFAMVQRWAVSTVIHVAHRGGYETPFSFTEKEPCSGKSSGNSHDGSNDEEERDSFQRANVGDTKPDSPSTYSIDVAAGSTPGPNEHNSNGTMSSEPGGEGGEDSEDDIELPSFPQLPTNDPFLQHLASFREYLTPTVTDKTTEMNRMYSVWRILKRAGRGGKGSVDIEWAPNNEYLLISWGNIQKKQIVLQELKDAILSEANRLDSAFQELTQNSNEPEFRINMIKDDPNFVSIFNLPANVAVLDQFIHSFKIKSLPSLFNADGKYTCSKGHLRKEATRFLERCSEFLKTHLIPHLYHTCGVPLRAWQCGRILYRSVNGHRRNLLISSRNVVYIANVPAKQRDQKTYSAFFPLPPNLGRILIYFLGVVRPVEVEIRRLYKADVVGYEHYIFPCPSLLPKRDLHIREGDINSALKSSSVLPYEARVQRQVFTAILDKLFPAYKLYLSQASSPVIAQGQHTPLVKNQHYALLRELKILGDTDFSQFAVSQTLQGWLELVPKNYEFNLFHRVDDQIDQQLAMNSSIALLVAVHGVRQHYQLTAFAQEMHEDIISAAEAEMDFLGYGLPMPDGSGFLFGTDLLVKVTSAVWFGDTQPLHFTGPPIGGVCVEYVVEAAILILRALKAARDDGQETPLASDRISANIRSEVRSVILHMVEHVRDREQFAWNRFSNQVYEAAFARN